MSTIEERLTALLLDYELSILTDANFAPVHSKAGAAIIAGWNAAEKALENVADDLSRAVITGYTTHEIRGTMATVLAAIAAMEGDSHTRDEAMVEDKRYERDDIYKK